MTEQDFEELRRTIRHGSPRGELRTDNLLEAVIWEAYDVPTSELSNALASFARRLHVEAADEMVQRAISHEQSYVAGQLMGLSRMINAKLGRAAALKYADHGRLGDE